MSLSKEALRQKNIWEVLSIFLVRRDSETIYGESEYVRRSRLGELNRQTREAHDVFREKLQSVWPCTHDDVMRMSKTKHYCRICGASIDPETFRDLAIHGKSFTRVTENGIERIDPKEVLSDD